MNHKLVKFKFFLFLEIRNAFTDFHGNHLYFGGFPRDFQADHAGAGVDGALLVEDEVADAVVDAVAVVILDGLQGVGVMADEDVGSGINQLAGLLALLGNGFQSVLSSPVKTDDDIGFGLRLAQAEDSLAKGIDAFLTDTGFVGQEGIVFERQPQRGKQPYRTGIIADKYRLDGFFQVVARPYGNYSCLTDILPSVHQSRTSLVYAVIVGQIEVSDVMLAERGEPFGLSTENEFLEVWLNGLGSRTFQVAHHIIRLTEQRIDTFREKVLDADMFNTLADSTVEQDVAGKEHLYGVFK